MKTPFSFHSAKLSRLTLGLLTFCISACNSLPSLPSLTSPVSGKSGTATTQSAPAKPADAVLPAASTPAENKTLPMPATNPEISIEKERKAETEAVEALPKVALTDELLYKLLTSEIAFQRGNWQAAYITILGVAQQTRDPRLAKRAAEIALSARQSSEAIAAIRLWRDLAPDSYQANQFYLGLQLVNNNLAEIKTIYSDRLSQVKPDEYPAIMLQAQKLLSRAQDKKAAFSTLEEILSPYKDTAPAHLALAQGAYINEDKPRSIREARAVLALQGDSQLAILTIAQASDKPQALKELSNFLERNPAAHDVRLAYGSILIELKQLDKAKLEFEYLLREQKNDFTSLYTLGAIAMDTAQFPAAEAYFKQFLNLLEAHPEQERDPTPALINLAQLALERHDEPAAQEWLAKVDSYDGKNEAWLSVQLRRAQLYAKTGKLEQALDFLKQIQVSGQSEQVQVIQAQSLLLKNAGQLTRAEAVLQEALTQSPDNPDFLYDIAMLAEQQKNFKQMETLLRRVIELVPNSQHAYNALGYSFVDRNIHLDEALKLLEKATTLAPEDPYIMDSLGWAQFRLGKLPEAITILSKAYQLRPDPEIALHLGEVLWVAGQPDQARKFWGLIKTNESEETLKSLKNTLLRLGVKP